MEEHTTILRQLLNEELSRDVDESSVDMDIFEELIDAGFISAINVCSDDGRGYLEPKITFNGRQYLQEHSPREISAKERLFTVGKLLYGVLIGAAILIAGVIGFWADLVTIFGN
ncbi:MAG: hypothetical protein OQJ84_05480 [Xanthomonadales bacterium]|nr:hypothetical protein [Xanthomonadales bacterium]